jgi:hypothetical protein
MRSLKKLISLFFCIALAGCARAPGAFVVQAAALQGDTLIVRSRWQPDTPVLDALDHGIGLPFVVSLRARGSGMPVARIQRHVQLRYFPLSRQYQLRDAEDGTVRNYAARGQAIAAMENLRLTGFERAGAEQFQVRIRLDRDALPGALRLPALLHAAWRMDSGDYAWHDSRSG